jgi:hypothetical protein
MPKARVLGPLVDRCARGPDTQHRQRFPTKAGIRRHGATWAITVQSWSSGGDHHLDGHLDQLGDFQRLVARGRYSVWSTRYQRNLKLCWSRDLESARRYHRGVDALERDDIERSQTTPPEVKLAQALEMMAAGFRLHRSKLERDHQDANPEEIERMFTDWLRADA